MASERERRFVGPRRGQLVFAAAFVLLTVVLLSQIGSQTRWVDNTKFFAQPRFWPAVGFIGMAVLGVLHLAKLPWRRITRFDLAEVKRWAMVAEYVAWFMVYVLAVPVIGYLLATLIFVPALTWRMGYRDRKMLIIGTAFGFCVVVIFKSFLSVKIPGGAIYEYLPSAVRSFFILNL